LPPTLPCTASLRHWHGGGGRADRRTTASLRARPHHRTPAAAVRCPEATRRRRRYKIAKRNRIILAASGCPSPSDAPIKVFSSNVSLKIWNGLLEDVSSATSLLTFLQKLKAHLFRQSYPGIIL